MIDDTKNDVLESRLVERLDETADIATLSSEQRDAAWQKVLADVTKKIATTPLPDVVRQAVVEGIALLDTLQQEIAATKQGSMLKRQAIRDKIEALKGLYANQRNATKCIIARSNFRKTKQTSRSDKVVGQAKTLEELGLTTLGQLPRFATECK